MKIFLPRYTNKKIPKQNFWAKTTPFFAKVFYVLYNRWIISVCKKTYSEIRAKPYKKLVFSQSNWAVPVWVYYQVDCWSLVLISKKWLSKFEAVLRCILAYFTNQKRDDLPYLKVILNLYVMKFIQALKETGLRHVCPLRERVREERMGR